MSDALVDMGCDACQRKNMLASITFGYPNTDLLGITLKPLRAWDYPNRTAFCPPKAMLVGITGIMQLVSD